MWSKGHFCRAGACCHPCHPYRQVPEVASQATLGTNGGSMTIEVERILGPVVEVMFWWWVDRE